MNDENVAVEEVESEENIEAPEEPKNQTLNIVLVMVCFSVAIFFYPFIAGYTAVGVDQSVKHNMIFFEKVVKKYLEHNMKPPASMDELVKDATRRRYHKTLYNPIRMVTAGQLSEKQVNQVVIFYSSYDVQNLSKDDKNPIHEGMVGYHFKGNHYYIYGHGKEGKLVKVANKPFVLTNDKNF